MLDDQLDHPEGEEYVILLQASGRPETVDTDGIAANLDREQEQSQVKLQLRRRGSRPAVVRSALRQTIGGVTGAQKFRHYGRFKTPVFRGRTHRSLPSSIR